MVIIPPGGIFLKKGAIVPNQNELRTVIHALNNEAAQKKHGNPSDEQINGSIAKLEQFVDYSKGS